MAGNADPRLGGGSMRLGRSRFTVVNADSSLPQRRKLCVLYVEDDDDDVYLVTRHLDRLASFDVNLSHARNLKAAHEMAASTQFDIVLCDFWLGCETTIPLIDQLRNGARSTPVVLVSSLDNEDIELIGRRAGVAGFVAKDDLSAASLDRIFSSLVPEDVEEPRGVADWLHSLLESLDKVQSAALQLPTDSTDQARILLNEVLAPAVGLREELLSVLGALESDSQPAVTLARLNVVPYLMDAVVGLSGRAEIRFIEPAVPIMVEANPTLFGDLIQGFFAEAANIASAGIPVTVVPWIRDGDFGITISATSPGGEPAADPRVAAAASTRRVLVEALAVAGGGSASFRADADDLLIGALKIPLRREII